MVASDNRTETVTTVDELDAMDIGRIITFKHRTASIAGTLAVLEHDPLLEEQGLKRSYTLTLLSGRSYNFEGTDSVTIHKPGLYSASAPIVGFHSVG